MQMPVSLSLSASAGNFIGVLLGDEAHRSIEPFLIERVRLTTRHQTDALFYRLSSNIVRALRKALSLAVPHGVFDNEQRLFVAAIILLNKTLSSSIDIF